MSDSIPDKICVLQTLTGGARVHTWVAGDAIINRNEIHQLTTQRIPQADSYGVVVIGAGSIGCSIADHLVDDYDVLVLEKGKLEESASTNANAFISDWWFFLEGEHIPGVAVKVRDYFEELPATGDFKLYAQPFTSLVDEDEAGSPETRKMRRDVEKIPGTEYFDVDELVEPYPDVLNLEGFVGGIVDTEAGYAKPRPYLRVMRERIEREGAGFEFGTEVTGIETETGSVTGATVAPDDLVQCDSVVVAAGTYTESLVAEFTDLPTRPFVICATAVRDDPASSGSVPATSDRGTLTGPNADGDLLVGDEYWIEDLDNIPRDFPKGAREKVAELLPQLFTGFGDGLEYVDGSEHHCLGGITITPDQVPAIDEVGDVDGLVAVDDSRGAVSLTPIITVVMQSILTGTETEFPLDRFAIDRFDLEGSEYDLPMITEPRS